MKKIYYSGSALLLAIFSFVIFSNFYTPDTLQKSPPLAPQGLVTEEVCGITVEDHYRNLENIEDEVVKKWLKQQEEYAKDYLNKIPRRQYLIDKQLEFNKRSTSLITQLRLSDDNQHFYVKRVGNENASKVFYRKNFSAPEQLLYDPKDFKPEADKTYSVNYVQPSRNGEKLIISLTEGGREFSEIIIMDVKTKELLPDRITNCRPADGPGITWLPDNSGFYYLHYPVSDFSSDLLFKDTKAVCHTLGQDSKVLNEVFSRTNNPKLDIVLQDFPVVTLFDKDDDYLFGELLGASRNADTYYAKIDNYSSNKYEWKLLFTEAEKIIYFYIFENDIIYLTGKNASKFKICKTPLDNPDFNNPTVLVEEKESEVIQTISVTSDGVYYVSTENGVVSRLYHIKDGIEKEIDLPVKAGTITLVSKGRNYPELWAIIGGWANSPIRYLYDFKNDVFEEAELTPPTEYPEFDDIVVEEVLVKSHDGVEVPLSIFYKKGIKRDGKAPVMFYSGGTYGISLTPSFNIPNLLFTMEGGILAVAHIRGGGEKGVEWHQTGIKTNKHNSWKDLIACAEYMVEEKYTSKKKIAIWSISAGCVSVGRAMTERPDLFGIAVPEAGVMNAMRFEKTPNGLNNIREFGTLENPEECKALYDMDAYLHIEKGVDYPATLITAGFNDPRVIIWQPAKFAAKLQAYQGSDKPILFLVDHDAGHGPGELLLKMYEARANTISFVLNQAGHPDYQDEVVGAKK